MKRLFLIAILFLAVACAKNDDIAKTSSNIGRIYTATMEQTSTKVFVDDKLNTLWTASDTISIFNTTFNTKFRFTGKTGDSEGTFEEVESLYHTGLDVPTTYAVYPYRTETSISTSGTLTISLPSTQNYAENSYGLKANTMVAATKTPSSKTLQFKSLCGFLVFNFYGSGTVKSISLRGNNEEKIAGVGKVTPAYGENPSLTMTESATGTVTLDCGNGVKLGGTKESITSFWMVVPPVNFQNGFTVTITDIYGGSFEKSISAERTISRNVKNSMSPLELKLTEEPKCIFKDLNFKKYCVKNFDTDKDGEVSINEASAVTEINVNTDSIASISGIEYFQNLISLTCKGTDTKEADALGQLTYVDLSKNTALRNLYLDNNHISDLDVSKNAALTTLECARNQLTSLDVSKNEALTNLRCSPMDDANGNNLLKTLVVNFRQNIYGVTRERSTFYIPSKTNIVLDTVSPGGSEPIGEDGEI